MIDFYNAFISYRHAPLDSGVAQRIQRSLEHFRVPSDIRKKTGRRKIERIFRDKDELTITSDLTDTIRDALSKAEYLIVICSPNTRESKWVQREIEFFLKNHSKKNILTVLAGGEPFEVIPKILLSDERTVTDEDGVQRRVNVPVEPLSCDYRLSPSKAKRYELPRLAAALLGCSYDELLRRQRQYRARRALASASLLTAAAVGFGLYMFHSKKKVDEALRQSLINQSKFLAGQSYELLDQGRRTDAIYLAMEALPEEGSDRPVTGEAISALCNATYAYDGLMGSTIRPVWNYYSGLLIKDFRISPSGTALAVLDENGGVACWDTDSHEILFKADSPGYSAFLACFISDDLLICQGTHFIRAYNVSDGELLWTLETDRIIDKCEALTIDDRHIMIIAHDGQRQLISVNTDTGRIDREHEIDIPDLLTVTVSGMALSPDGNKVAIILTGALNESYIGSYDLLSGQLILSDLIDSYVEQAEWIGNDRFIAAAADFGRPDSSRIGTNYILTEDSVRLICMDASSAEVIWEAEHSYNNLSYKSGILPLTANNMVAYYRGDSCSSYDIDTGEMLYHWISGDSIVDASDRDGDGWPLLLLRNGGVCFPNGTLSNALYVTYDLPDGIFEAKVNHGIYLIQDNGRQIIYCNTYVSDDEWEQTPDVEFGLLTDYFIDDDVLAITSSEEEGERLILIDPEDNELIYDGLLGDSSIYSSSCKILGSDEDNVYITASGSDGVVLFEVRKTNGRIGSQVIASPFSALSAQISMNDGVICYMYDSAFDLTVGLYDTANGRNEEFIIGNSSKGAAPARYCEDLGIIYVTTDEGDKIIDVEDGEIIDIDLPEGWNGTNIIRIDGQGELIFITDGRRIVSVDRDGDMINSFDSRGRKPIGIGILRSDIRDGAMLLAVTSDGELYRFDALEAEFLGASDISTYSNFASGCDLVFDEESGLLYLQQHLLTGVVDTSSWIELFYVESSFGHHAPTDRFFTFSYESSNANRPGYFRHYSYGDLLQKARDIIGSNSMPDDMRSRYGL